MASAAYKAKRTVKRCLGARTSFSKVHSIRYRPSMKGGRQPSWNMLAAAIGPNVPAMLTKEIRQLDASREFQLDRDSDRIPWEITRRRFAVFVEQLHVCETRYSGEHAGGIERGDGHARLEITVEDIAGRTVRTHTPVFNPDGSRTDLFRLSHVVSGHKDGFPLTEQGGNEGEALLAEKRIVPLQHIVPEQNPRFQECHHAKCQPREHDVRVFPNGTIEPAIDLRETRDAFAPPPRLGDGQALPRGRGAQDFPGRSARYAIPPWDK